ncbi:MAG TPA: hypothetical protein VHU80_25155, partial [Polyangiaceae bacterium]|nr:hypothetical protein [Polyangiaceae bacterium]
MNPVLGKARTFVRRTKPEYVALFIALVAVALRVVHRAPTWQSSDAANLPDFVSQFVCRQRFDFAYLEELGLYRLGGVQPLVLYFQMVVLRALHWHVTELTWESSQIVVSAASTYAAFLFAREVGGAAAGLSAAALLSVTPLGISLGRHLGAPWPYEEGFQYLILFLLVAYLRRPERGLRVGFAVALAIYFWVGNQGLGVVPVVGYVLVAGFVELGGKESLAAFVRRRLTWWFALPAASLALLFYCTFVLRRSHLYHALFHKRHTLGLYVAKWLDDAAADIGQSALYLAIAIVLLGVLAERRWLSQRHAPSMLCLAYAAPFWVAIPPGSTLTRGYVMYGVSALLIAACVYAFSPRLREVRVPALLAVIAFVQVGSSLKSTYRVLDGKLFSTLPFQGAYGGNNGIMSAAAWIRSRGPARGSVLSDASGGTGLEPSIIDMYLFRPSYGVNDAPSATFVYKEFSRYARHIEYVLVSPANHRLAQTFFPGFARALDVRDGRGGELILSVYAKGATGKIETLDVHDGDAEFRTRHSMLC